MLAKYILRLEHHKANNSRVGFGGQFGFICFTLGSKVNNPVSHLKKFLTPPLTYPGNKNMSY